MQVEIQDIDLLRRQICDRVCAFVLARIAQLEREPVLSDVVRHRRDGALAQLRLLAAELLPSVRRIGGFAPTEEELAAVRLWLGSAHAQSADVAPILRRLVDVYGGVG